MKVLDFETVELRDRFDENLMPVMILVLKMGIIMSFIITTQVSFTDDRIFPSNRRNTSVGTCGMIARSVTIVAPIVNEWPAPIPIVIILVFSVIGLATSITFPMEGEFAQGEELKDKHFDLRQESETDENRTRSISYHDLSNEIENDINKVP